MPEELTIDVDNVENTEAYPVKVGLRHLARTESNSKAFGANGNDTTAIANGLFRSNLTADTTEAVLHEAQDNAETFTEEVRAKYMVGCDGAHSWTRRQIGSVMEGEQTDFIW